MPANIKVVDLPEGWDIYKSGVIGFVLEYNEDDVCFMNDSGLHFFSDGCNKSIPIDCIELLLSLSKDSYDCR